MVLSIALFFLAYLIGSIPSAVWIGKMFYGTDVRLEGSKNAGATNTFRVLGKRAGIIVLTLDIAKGVGAVCLSYEYGPDAYNPADLLLVRLLLGLSAVLGHLYPVFAGFRGGKGVATLTGVAFAVFPWAGLLAVAIFILTFLISRYVSLSSMLAAVSFALAVLFIFYRDVSHQTAVVVIVSCIPLLVIYTHRQNIGRLVQGKENRFLFRK